MKAELTKELLVSILKKARELHKKEEKISDSFKETIELLAPSSYPPFLELDALNSFSKGIDMIFPGIGEDISYFIYEAPRLRDAKCTIPGVKRKYDAHDINDYADFILGINNI